MAWQEKMMNEAAAHWHSESAHNVCHMLANDDVMFVKLGHKRKKIIAG
jgi:hypothetical protein